MTNRTLVNQIKINNTANVNIWDVSHITVVTINRYQTGMLLTSPMCTYLNRLIVVVKTGVLLHMKNITYRSHTICIVLPATSCYSNNSRNAFKHIPKIYKNLERHLPECLPLSHHF